MPYTQSRDTTAVGRFAFFSFYGYYFHTLSAFPKTEKSVSANRQRSDVCTPNIYVSINRLAVIGARTPKYGLINSNYFENKSEPEDKHSKAAFMFYLCVHISPFIANI